MSLPYIGLLIWIGLLMVAIFAPPINIKIGKGK